MEIYLYHPERGTWQTTVDVSEQARTRKVEVEQEVTRTRNVLDPETSEPTGETEDYTAIVMVPSTRVLSQEEHLAEIGARYWPEGTIILPDKPDPHATWDAGVGAWQAGSPPAPDPQMVNQERDKRIASGVPFEVDGKLHVFDFDQMGKDNITGAASLAKFAILAGAKPDDYRWTGGNHDFTWITQANELVRMDAHTVSALGDVSANWTTRHIYAARTLKDMAPIPQDYADDKYWP